MNSVEPFKLDGGVILKGLLLSPSAGWPIWTVLAAAAVLIGVGIWIDVRWIVVGLMLCVAVAPCIVAFLYFSHVLSPDIVPNMIPHTLERCRSGYILRTWRRTDPDDPDDDGEWGETGTIYLEDSNITLRKTSFEYETLYFRDSRMKILYVPRFKK